MRQLETRGSTGWTVRDYPTLWWRRPFRRTLVRAEVQAPDGCAYVVRAVRVLRPRDGVAGSATGWAADLAPDPMSTVMGGAGLLAMRVQWGVRVYCRAGRFRPTKLVYGEHARTASDGTKRVLEIARILQARPRSRPKRRG